MKIPREEAIKKSGLEMIKKYQVKFDRNKKQMELPNMTLPPSSVTLLMFKPVE